MNSIFLIGGGGHCNSCIDVIESEKKFEIVGIIEKANSSINSVLKYPIIGDDGDMQELVSNYKNAFISIGQINTSETRVKLFKVLKKLGAEFPIVISPYAYVSKNANIGSGTIVMHGAIINSKANVGDNCIINTKALIEHDVLIADHCHIATNATINGSSSIGRGSFVGSGAIVIQGINIGENCIIGAGALVTKDVASNSTIRGKK